MDCLPGFRPDPPRGKNFTITIVLLTKADEKEGLHIHKLEYVEPQQVKEAVLCTQKLRRLSKGVHTVSTDKRSHSVALVREGMSQCTTKKARTLASSTDRGQSARVSDAKSVATFFSLLDFCTDEIDVFAIGMAVGTIRRFIRRRSSASRFLLNVAALFRLQLPLATVTEGFDAVRSSHSRRSSACGSANHAIAGGGSV